jgi:hypothetical protein
VSLIGLRIRGGYLPFRGFPSSISLLHLFIVILPWICLDQPHWPVLGNKETDNSKLYWMPVCEEESMVLQLQQHLLQRLFYDQPPT